MLTLQDILTSFRRPGSARFEDWLAWMSQATHLFFESRREITEEHQQLTERTKGYEEIAKAHETFTDICHYLHGYLKWSKTLGNEDAHKQSRQAILSSCSTMTEGVIKLASIPQKYRKIESVENAKQEYAWVIKEKQRLQNLRESMEIDKKRSDELARLASSNISHIQIIYDIFSTSYNKLFEFQNHLSKVPLDLTSSQFSELVQHYRSAVKNRYCNFNSLMHLLNAGAYYARYHPDDITLSFLVLQELMKIEIYRPTLEYVHQAYSLLYMVKSFLLKHDLKHLERISDGIEPLTLERLDVIQGYFDEQFQHLKPSNVLILLSSSSSVADSTHTFYSDFHALCLNIETEIMTCPDEFKSVFEQMADYLRFYPNAFPHQKNVLLLEVNQLLKEMVELRRLENPSIKLYVANFTTLVTRSLLKDLLVIIDCAAYSRITKELKAGIVSKALLGLLKKANLMPKIVQIYIPKMTSECQTPLPCQVPPLLEELNIESSQEIIDDETDWILVKYSRNREKKLSHIPNKNKKMSFFGKNPNPTLTNILLSTQNTTSSLQSELSATKHSFVTIDPTKPLQTDAVASVSSQVDVCTPSIDLDTNSKRSVTLPIIIQEGFQRLNPHASFLVGSSVLQLLTSSDFSQEQDIDFVSASHPWYHFGILIHHVGMLGVLYLNQDYAPYLMDCFVPSGIKDGHFFEQDLEARDFTICTLYCNSRGEIFDPTGLGLDDHENKILRLHKVKQARTYEESVQISIKCFIDDPIQIMRSIKYIEKGYTPSPELADALSQVTLDASNINRPHLYAVTRKILRTYDPESIVQKLNQYGLLQKLFQLEINSAADLAQLYDLIRTRQCLESGERILRL